MEIVLTEEVKNKVNGLAPNEWQTNEQGIWTEPFGVPDSLKEPLIYMRYETGGVSGGSCWDESDSREYFVYAIPEFKVLDLQELKPDISYIQYKKIEELIVDSEKTDYEYYGNSTDFRIKYIEVSKLLAFLNSL